MFECLHPLSNNQDIGNSNSTTIIRSLQWEVYIENLTIYTVSIFIF